MTKKVTLALFIFSAFLFSELSAQNVYFSGLGRALVTTNGLTDNTNTASKLKSSGGYTLFDLGIYGKSSDVLRGGVILRTKNAFGGFFSDGALLSFRQMQLEGLISKKVKYEIGDVYLTHTPYTLWNGDSADYKHEASIFSLRRDIVNYENFFVGNAWRMQGFNTKAKINFSKGVESLGIRVYGGRTRQTNFTSIPDRYFYGGRLDLLQSRYFRIAGNVASISDIAGTVKAAEVDYNNMVYTTDFGLTLDSLKSFGFAVLGEAGISQFRLTKASDSTDKRFDDYFYDMGVKATYRPLNLNIGASYRNVGFNFNSPMAQSRRMAAPSDITLGTFPLMNDGKSKRAVGLYDIYSQENNMFNQGISTTLMKYFLQYNIVEPYGKATPNRKGFTFSADVKDGNKLFNADVQVNLLSEIAAEGDSVTYERRKFTLIRAGLVFNINKLLDYEKVISVSGGIRTESSSRVSTNPVNLASSLIDLGLDIEVLKSLHLLGGVKLFKISGNEFESERNEVNSIVNFKSRNFNETQTIFATGLRYDYDKSGYFSMHYNLVKADDKELPAHKYDLNQLFFVFGLKF